LARLKRVIGCQDMVISSFGVVWGSETEFTLGLRAVVYLPIIEFSLGLQALKLYVNYVYTKCKPTNFVKCKPGVNFVFLMIGVPSPGIISRRPPGSPPWFWPQNEYIYKFIRKKYIF